MGQLQVVCLANLGLIWFQFWVDFGPTLRRIRDNFVELWDSFELTLGSLDSLRPDFGPSLGQLLGRLWVNFGSTLGQLCADF